MSVLLVLALLAQSTDFLTEGNRALDAQQYDRAVELFSKAATADPKDYAAQFQLGLAYSLLGKDAEAIPHYKSALEFMPGLYEAELNLGLSLLRSQNATEALPHLEAAAEKKPTVTAESALARALVQQKRLTEAEPHYRKAANLDASRKPDLLELAAAYEEAKKPAEAIAIYREFPEHAGAQKRLGLLLKAAGQGTESIAALEAAAAQSPTDANLVALAQAYLAAKRVTDAEAVAARAVSAQPKDSGLRLFYGRILRDQRKFPAAATQFLAAAQIKPDSVEAWNELAAALSIMDQYQQSITALDKVRSLGAESPGNLFLRALALDHLQQLKEALAAYQAFLGVSESKFPDQEFQARGRIRVLELEIRKRK
jgi:tetratricopeptide (TPR) repeat protein